LFVAGSIVGGLAIVYLGIAAVVLAVLMWNDYKAKQMWNALGRRIRLRDPQFKDVYENLSFWQNGRPQNANAFEQAWNRAYPAVVGKVRNQEELDAVHDLIREVCDDYQYDPELVIVQVRIEP
jgi:hypothetical protein